MSSKTPLDTTSTEASDPAVSAKNAKKKKNVQSVIGQIGLDMIPVVAGILIALFINNLQQNYRDKKLLESTLQSLSEEFKENKENIDLLLPLQKRFLDTLQHYKEDNTYSIFDIATKASKMGTPDIYSTNWQASLNNNSIQLLNFQTIHLLSQIESKYRELKEQETMIASITLGPPMFKTGEEGLEYRNGMELWITSYIGNEEELLELYKKFEEIVRNKQYTHDSQ